MIIASYLPREACLVSERHKITYVCCHDDLDYWRALHHGWEHVGDIVNIEHDMACTDSHITEILDCAEPLCTYAYRCHWVTTRQPGGVSAQRFEGREVGTGEQYATWSGIGLCKIAPRARTSPLKREPWHQLESAVNDAVIRRWHIHWPEVIHHHW